MGYAVYVRYKHFRRIQHEIADMTWMHALDFAWLVIFTNVLRDMEQEMQQETEASERLYQAALA